MRRRDERGAIALVTAAVMVVLLGVAAFVVDIGMQRVARQDLQALADVVALDLARMLDGRTAQEIEDGDPSLDEAWRASVARNTAQTVGDPDSLDVIPTLLVPDEGASEPGSWRTAGDTEEPEAVRVSTSTRVDFGFAGAIGFSSGGAARSSVAAARSSACFHLGSYAAAIERDAALVDPLNDLLALDLTLFEYRALASAALSLDDLVAEPSIGSASKLLDGPLKLDELIAAAKVVLQAQPGGNAPAVDALNRVAERTDGDLGIELREVLVVTDDDLDALRTDQNVLDLLGPALLSATDVRLLEDIVDGTGLDAPPADGVVAVTAGAQRICGLGEATESAAVEVSVDGGFEFVRRGLTVTAEISVDAALGGAKYALAAPAQCRAAEEDTDRYEVAYSGGSPTQLLTTVIDLDGQVTRPPQDVVSIAFSDLTVVPALGLNVPLDPPGVESPAGVEVPGNAINVQPNRGDPVPTGAALEEFDRIPRIPRSFMLDNVEIVFAEPLNEEERAAAQARAERRVNFVRLLINRTLRSRTEVATDAITTGVRAYTDVLGVRRTGVDLYSEVRPTCIGVRLVE